MIIALDQMAQRYGRLPHECLAEANTFDFMIMDAAITYINNLNNKDKPIDPNKVDIETLIAIKEGRL